MINVTQTFLPPLEEYVSLLEKIWDTKWLTNRGILVKELEATLCDHLGVPNLLAVSNGTIALQIVIKALGLTGEIITTPFSYVATVSSIVWEGCTPVFVDIDPEYLTLDASKIEGAITDKTSAILATHVYGNPCDVDAIEEIGKRRGLKVIYDAAHCFGVNYKGTSILNRGDASTLSFHATKLFHTAEGGAVVCPDADTLEAVFNHHNFGHKSPEEFFGLGINGKMSELSAAMGLALLPHMNDIVARRKAACDAYDRSLDFTKLRKPVLRPGTEWNYAYYPVIFETERKLLAARQALYDSGVNPRRYFYPSLDDLPYLTPADVPVSKAVSQTVMCLPLSAELDSEVAENIARTIDRSLESRI
jgi:dTDP-4-amino-4,6-dideoxygalactose transaminase